MSQQLLLSEAALQEYEITVSKYCGPDGNTHVAFHRYIDVSINAPNHETDWYSNPTRTRSPDREYRMLDSCPAHRWCRVSLTSKQAVGLFRPSDGAVTLCDDRCAVRAIAQASERTQELFFLGKVK